MIHFFEADIDWVRELVFEDNMLAQRTDQIRCAIVEIPEFDWTVFHFLAPQDYGLWWLRVYPAFDGGLRAHFREVQSKYLRTTLPENDLKQIPFAKFLRANHIKKQSDHAYECFGMYPRLWGNTFAPKKGHSSFIDRRYVSVAVPRSASQATRQYFKEQARQFGADCTALANERSRLWNSGHPGHKDFQLLCGGPSNAGAEELQSWLARLERLIFDRSERDRFSVEVDVGVKFSGAVNVAIGNRFFWEKWSKECPIYIDILRARVMLIGALGWVPSLVDARSQLAGDEWRENPVVDLIPMIETALARFPIVLSDPLA